MTGPSVLTTASTFTCAHEGKVKADSATRLRVGKVAVLVADVTGRDITDCNVKDVPSTATLKCRIVSSATAGQSAKLTVEGVSVLLDVLAGLSNGTPPPTGAPLLPPTVNQTRLRAAVAAM